MASPIRPTVLSTSTRTNRAGTGWFEMVWTSRSTAGENADMGVSSRRMVPIVRC